MNTSTINDAIRAAWQATGPDEDALHEMRREALEQFLRTGLPTTRQENWKYTNLSGLAERLADDLRGKPAAQPSQQQTLSITGAVQVTFVDGIYRPELSAADELPPGVQLHSIAAMAEQQPAQLRELYGRFAAFADSPMVALNSAFAGHGAVLELADGVELARPICISYRSGRSHIAAQTRLLVSLGAQAQATVVEHFCSTDSVFVNPVTELHCGPGARLDYCRLQDEHPETWHTALQCAALAENAHLHTTQVDIGGALARNELRLNLNGRGAHAEAHGLFMADAARHVDSRIDVNHLAPDTTSRERYRGILADRARGVFNGRIYVARDAQKTIAELTNRNLLLNKRAEVNSKPELEIYADDVKCAHGSTTGQLDANSLFYLLSRGVDRRTARNMLITAFAAELLTGMQLPEIAARAQQALETLQTDSDQAGS